MQDHLGHAGRESQGVEGMMCRGADWGISLERMINVLRIPLSLVLQVEEKVLGNKGVAVLHLKPRGGVLRAHQKFVEGPCLVIQWLGICLPLQGT